MAALVWDEVGKHFYETGVSRGVFYDVTGYGVAWNGLTAIEEEVSSEVQAVHFDGVKFNDIVTMGDFTATLKAWTYPDEFLPYEGILEDVAGFFVADQPQSQFGLSYRTEMGDDVNGITGGYKIHLLYNLTALPSTKIYQTLSLDTTPHEFEWTITAIPENIENYRPTAHIIFDSRKMDPNLLQDLEDIIYGDADSPPRMPPLKGLATYIKKWARLIITDHGDGTWSAESPLEGIITMLDDTTFQIISETAIYLDPETYQISSTYADEEDLWPL